MNIIMEGKARFYASVADDGKISKELDVFYNPVMKFNRDISVLLLNSLDIADMQIADIMAGSGVRSLRFLKELKSEKIKNITVNDHDPAFPGLFEKNLALNDISKLDKDKIIILSKDANILLLESRGFDYIDVDPFGSPNDFLESSISRLSRDGVLAVTATDTAPLSGTYIAACVRKYWAKPMRNYMMHETGLRILIRKIQLIGAQHDKALIPLYSYFKDHYFRISFRCIKGKKSVDEVLVRSKYLLFCEKCLSLKVSEFNHEKCESCVSGEFMQYSGPLWTGELCDKNLSEDISKRNIEKANNTFLEILENESELNLVGFYDIHALCKHFKLDIPRQEILMEKVSDKDYFVSRTHFCPTAIKTNMPVNELVDLIRKLGDKRK